MDYEMFKEVIKEGLKERLSEDISISLKKVTKNNGVILDGLIVSGKEQKIAPTFYINDFYSMYENGKGLDEVIDCLAESYNEHCFDISFDVDEFENFDRVKNNIMFKLVNRQLNSDLLEKIPNRDFLDLTVCYYVFVKNVNFDTGSILISNEHMKMWGVDEKTLYELSLANTVKSFRHDILSMYDMMCELMIKRGAEEDMIENILKPIDEKMYVLTNESRQFGASCIMYKDVLQDFSDEKESDLVIIPSSVHEVIIIPLKDCDSFENLNDMVKEVNNDHVLLQEILSDHVYLFDRKEGRIKMC